MADTRVYCPNCKHYRTNPASCENSNVNYVTDERIIGHYGGRPLCRKLELKPEMINRNYNCRGFEELASPIKP